MDKSLLIIGASSEVGVQYIKKYHQQYNRIWAHYNQSKEELCVLKELIGDKLYLEQADLLSPRSTEQLVNNIKTGGYFPSHILHLPAGKYRNYKFHKTTWSLFQDSLNIQLRSIVEILEAFLPSMTKSSYGKIVFLLSSCTVNLPPKYLSDYVTSKYALLGFMKAISAEYASKGICINGISPGMMETKLLDQVSDIIIQQNASLNPRGRNTAVSDVIPMVDFLLSEDSGFITGQNVVITGGIS